MGHITIKIDLPDQWHKERAKGIGGSDVACILGLNKYKSNVDLWREKTGRIKADTKSISNKPAVIYGKKAEEYLRELFILDYPQYEITHSPYNIHKHKDYDFMRASLDGELKEIKTQEKGILEIKTTTILNPEQWKEWDGQIPYNYFCQLLHYFAVDEDFKFAKLKAKIRYFKPNDPEVYATIRHYHILRENHLQDIEYLTEQEKIFWNYVITDKEPPLKLPNI